MLTETSGEFQISSREFAQSGEGSQVPWEGRRCPGGCEPGTGRFPSRGCRDFGRGLGRTQCRQAMGNFRSALHASHSHPTHFVNGSNHFKGCQESPSTEPGFSKCSEQEEMRSEALPYHCVGVSFGRGLGADMTDQHRV